jgi:hypothetical protein
MFNAQSRVHSLPKQAEMESANASHEFEVVEKSRRSIDLCLTKFDRKLMESVVSDLCYTPRLYWGSAVHSDQLAFEFVQVAAGAMVDTL